MKPLKQQKWVFFEITGRQCAVSGKRHISTVLCYRDSVLFWVNDTSAQCCVVVKLS